MIITQERITPETAQKYLEKNTNNYRKMNLTRVSCYATDMKAGKWQYNGEGIKFAKNGILLDGQHRLAAIVKAGVPVDMLVIRDIEDNVNVYDIGSSRSLAMILQEGNTLVATAAFIVNNCDTRKYKGNMVIADYVIKHKELLQSAYNACSVTSKAICRKAAVLAATYCLLRDGEDYDEICNFFRTANSGLPAGNNDPSSALIFRNLLPEHKCKDTDDRRQLFCITYTAIKDYLKSKHRQLTYRATPEGLDLLFKIRSADGLTDR